MNRGGSAPMHVSQPHQFKHRGESCNWSGFMSSCGKKPSDVRDFQVALILFADGMLRDRAAAPKDPFLRGFS